MRGGLDFEKVLHLAASSGDVEFMNFATDRLQQDCKHMKADETLLNLYQEIRKSAWIVVATDNMDCFANAFLSTQSIKTHFDDFLCSSELGVLKSESPIDFFGGWLNHYGLSFRDALLIDDSLSNCQAFAKAGGNSILFTSSEDIEQRLRGFVLSDKPNLSANSALSQS